jgi:PPK2 family polyphosphate:nucleotide phosphotransferase
MAADYDDLLRYSRVQPGKSIDLRKDYDPGKTAEGWSKEEANQKLAEGISKLAEWQEKLYADNTYALLIVFQALDAAGKDSTIKHVMSGVNPQGVDVTSFKAPSSEELDHDYLWRNMKALPERGRIGIFNRSYYEEVLVTRVHPEILENQNLPPGTDMKKIWGQRFEEINNFEKYLVNNGIIVLKFFLYVSKDEQKKRFLERLDLPEKNWKFSTADVKERLFWDKYIDAYEELINHTSTKWAPWFIMPADHKWMTQLGVAAIIYNTLAGLDISYPEVDDEAKKDLALARKQLLEEDGGTATDTRTASEKDADNEGVKGKKSGKNKKGKKKK